MAFKFLLFQHNVNYCSSMHWFLAKQKIWILLQLSVYFSTFKFDRWNLKKKGVTIYAVSSWIQLLRYQKKIFCWILWPKIFQYYICQKVWDRKMIFSIKQNYSKFIFESNCRLWGSCGMCEGEEVAKQKWLSNYIHCQ